MNNYPKEFFHSWRPVFPCISRNLINTDIDFSRYKYPSGYITNVITSVK